MPTTAPRLQKGMLLKVKQLLADLGLPPRPLPTKVRVRAEVVLCYVWMEDGLGSIHPPTQ